MAVENRKRKAELGLSVFLDEGAITHSEACMLNWVYSMSSKKGKGPIKNAYNIIIEEHVHPLAPFSDSRTTELVVIMLSISHILSLRQ